MALSLPLDPYDVLGLAPGASAAEVREAFRTKARKHHPDRGGDDWAFRIVVQAYEVLMASLGEVEEPSRPASASEFGEGGQIRAGVKDSLADPWRLVAVELVRARRTVGDVIELVGGDRARKGLIGSLQMWWPDPNVPGIPSRSERAAEVLDRLVQVFDLLRAQTPVLSARSESDLADGRFECRLTYADAGLAWRAFQTLRTLLNSRNLGVRQWTRDVVVKE